MQYSEVTTLLSDSEFVKACITTGKKPSEVAKTIINNRHEFEVWNRCHVEYGKLTKVEHNDYDNGSYTVDIEFEGRKNKRGGNIYNCKTKFMKDNYELFNHYNSMIGSYCKFYVGYVENADDGSVFRSLLDIEPAHYAS